MSKLPAERARTRTARGGAGGTLRARAGSTRIAGLAVAAVLSLAFAGLIVFYVTRGPRVSSAGLDGQETPRPPDIKDIENAQATSGSAALAGGDVQVVTFTDRNDPTRVAGRLGWDRMEPLEGKRYRLENPRSFNFLRDGRVIYVRADSGNFVSPRQDQEPQSGTLSGNVEVRLFAASPKGTRVDPDKDVPTLVARMDTIDFDSTLGELTTDSRVVGHGDFGEFSFTGMHVVTNQTAHRVELLEIGRGERIVLKPKGLRRGGAARAEADAGQAVALNETQPKASGEAPVVHAPIAGDQATGERAPRPPAPQPPVSEPAASRNPTTGVPFVKAPDASVKAAGVQDVNEQFYAAVFSDDVKVVQGDKEITSDRLRSWVRLVDDKLAPGATGETTESGKGSSAGDGDGARKDTRGDAGTRSGGEGKAATHTPARDWAVSQTPPTSPVNFDVVPMPGELRASDLAQGQVQGQDGGQEAAVAQPAASADGRLDLAPTGDDVTITWTGPLVLKAEKERPAPLATDEVTVRCESDLAGGTRFRATSQKAEGSATDVEYYATTRRAVLIGDDTTPAVVRSEGAGRLEAKNVLVGIATGVVEIGSGGVLVQEKGKHDGADEPQRRIVWSESAQFAFDTRHGQMTSSLREALLHGGVEARDGSGVLTGGFLHALFIPSPRAEGQAALRRIEVRDQVTGDDGHGGTLSAGELDLAFVPVRKGETGFGESEPREMEARGAVRVIRGGITLDTDRLRAGLKGKGSGVDVTDVKADGMVRFTRDDGVTAVSDQLRADATQEIVELMGEHVSLGKGASTVSGTSMVLKGHERSLEVFGAGTFEHNPGAQQPENDTANPASDMGQVLATWQGGMVFSDVTGVLDADGAVRATYSPGPLEQDKLEGEHLHLELTPGEKSSDGIASLDLGSKPKAEHAAAKQDDRQLLLASVTGSDQERSDGTRAKVESRTYRANEDASEGRELESLVYLEGSMIVGDNVGGTLSVPCAGMMLSYDKRNTPSKVVVVGEEPSTARGTTRVRWTDGMDYERAEGRATVRGGVKLDHAPIESRDKTELESQKLVVHFRDAERMDAGGVRQVRGQFLGATASGAVWARSMGKELTSDQLEYDAASRTIEAIASEGNLAQMFDPKSPTPMTARRLFWDMAHDRVEIRDAGTVTAPR